MEAVGWEGPTGRLGIWLLPRLRMLRGGGSIVFGRWRMGIGRELEALQVMFR